MADPFPFPRRLGWSAEDLARRRKDDPGKLAIAARLRWETALTIKAIATRLQLGTYQPVELSPFGIFE